MSGAIKKRFIVSLALSLSFLLFFAAAPTFAQPAQEDPIPERALVAAVEQGDRAKVLALLKAGANIDKRWINHTPLETAIFEQDVEMVKLLLDKGARINSGDLADAAHGSQGDEAKALIIVKLLFAKGADARTDGAEALRDATIAHNLDVVKLLLAKGANPNGKDQSGNAVLMAVVASDFLEGIQALLEAGADVKAVNENQGNRADACSSHGLPG